MSSFEPPSFSDDELDSLFEESDYLSDDEYFAQLADTAIILNDYGWRDPVQFTVELTDENIENLRGATFNTMAEAVQYLVDGGIIQIGRVAEDDYSDWRVLIEDMTP